MKTNEMKKRILALSGISALCILIIAFGLSIFKNKNVSADEKAIKAYNYLEANTDLFPILRLNQILMLKFIKLLPIQ